MGTYLNPGNSGFEEIINSAYVDKTGLIGQINRTIGTKQKLTCISRPRRFGKSYAAQMLCAYYDKTCDSTKLFDRYEISKDETYLKYLNKYDVIYLDMTNVMGEAGKMEAVSFIRRKLTEELSAAYPDLQVDESLSTTMINAAEQTGNKFIMVIDEWDAPIREVPEVQKEYLEFLRTLFKSSGTTSRIFAAVYMTGILPIKKDGSQSAISDFEEYSMIAPWSYSQYVGFTENEVRKLCEENQSDFHIMSEWYDGYTLKGTGSVYNPNSVMKAVRYRSFRSYWTETSASESLMSYISKPQSGLAKTIVGLIGGVETEVDTNGFSNDLVTFKSRDDVLTLLIHLGYLAYDEDSGKVRIPNEEVRLEFVRAVRGVKSEETQKRVAESDRLIYDTIHLNADAVAAQIEKVHAEETAPLHYNEEEALRSVIKLAYFSYRDHYVKFEELPSGDGYADIVYLPKQNSQFPALVIELKWNKSVEGAVSQIKNKRYFDAFKDYGGEILLVGINYDKDAGDDKRKHNCVIEKLYR